MRLIFSLLLVGGALCGGYWLWHHKPEIRSYVENKINHNEFHTLEIRYNAEGIMDAHRKDFLKNENYCFLEPKLVFYPHLLMEVKFAKDALTTQEGVLLFGLDDGEMVLDGHSWEKTHGFKDCLQAHASDDDFKLLRPIIQAGGMIDKDQLQQKCKGLPLEKWIESCKAKKLITIQGSKIRLHFDKPLLTTTPLSNLQEKSVLFPAKSEQKIPLRFSISQVEKMMFAAFGSDFAILKKQEVYLPVYKIGIQNPDGSILMTSWNALTGKRMD